MLDTSQHYRKLAVFYLVFGVLILTDALLFLHGGGALYLGLFRATPGAIFVSAGAIGIFKHKMSAHGRDR